MFLFWAPLRSFYTLSKPCWVI